MNKPRHFQKFRAPLKFRARYPKYPLDPLLDGPAPDHGKTNSETKTEIDDVQSRIFSDSRELITLNFKCHVSVKLTGDVTWH